MRLITSIVALFVCLFVCLFSNVSFFVVVLVAFLKFFEAYSDIIYAYYNAHDQTKLISKSLFIKGVFSVGGMLIGLYFFNFYIALILFLLIYL
ncbi:hypothetical protein K036_4407, partial [Acinetobacter baumannii 42057_5]